MKYRPSKEERANADPLIARDLRRQICKRLNDMSEKELQKLLWKLEQGKR